MGSLPNEEELLSSRRGILRLILVLYRVREEADPHKLCMSNVDVIQCSVKKIWEALILEDALVLEEA